HCRPASPLVLGNAMGRVRLAFALAAVLVLAAPGAPAQTYPTKTATLVVPFPAGDSTDWLPRWRGLWARFRLHPGSNLREVMERGGIRTGHDQGRPRICTT